MTALLSILAVLAIAIYYYQRADHTGKPALSWCAAGILAYYAGFLLWMYGILRPLLGAKFHTHSFGTGIMMDISAIVFGVTVAIILSIKTFREEKDSQ